MPRSSKVLTMAVGAAVAVLILLFIYPSLVSPASGVKVEHLKLLLPGSQLSSMALNTSSYQAWRSLSSPVNRTAVSAALSMAEKAEDMLKKALKASSLIHGDLGRRIARSSDAYLKMDESAINLSSSADLLDPSRKDVEEALNLLIAGNVSEALSHWMKVRNNVLKAYELVLDSLSKLEKVNNSDLLSDEHRVMLDEARNRTSALASELAQIILLFETVRKNPENAQQVIKAYLNARNGRKSSVTPNQNLINAANRLDPSKGGRFSYQISLFKEMIEYFSKGGENASGKGAGAGWKGRPDD